MFETNEERAREIVRIDSLITAEKERIVSTKNRIHSLENTVRALQKQMEDEDARKDM